MLVGEDAVRDSPPGDPGDALYCEPLHMARKLEELMDQGRRAVGFAKPSCADDG